MGLSERRESRWISRATISLPVPFSPRMRTFASVGAARSTSLRTRSIAADCPSKGVSGIWASSVARPRSIRASSRLRRSDAALLTVASSRSLLHGLATKSLAPALIASTATDTPPCAVMMTTAASGSMSITFPRYSRPSRLSVRARSKLRSSRIASGLSPLRRGRRSAGELSVSTRSNMSRNARRAARAISGSSSTTTARLNLSATLRL